MLSPEQRKWQADKIGDLANLAVAALIFGQFASGQFRLGIAIGGVIFLILGFLYSNSLLKHHH